MKLGRSWHDRLPVVCPSKQRIVMVRGIRLAPNFGTESATLVRARSPLRDLRSCWLCRRRSHPPRQRPQPLEQPTSVSVHVWLTFAACGFDPAGELATTCRWTRYWRASSHGSCRESRIPVRMSSHQDALMRHAAGGAGDEHHEFTPAATISYHRRPRRFGAYSRSTTLPCQIRCRP